MSHDVHLFGVDHLDIVLDDVADNREERFFLALCDFDVFVVFTTGDAQDGDLLDIADIGLFDVHAGARTEERGTRKEESYALHMDFLLLKKCDPKVTKLFATNKLVSF